METKNRWRVIALTVALVGCSEAVPVVVPDVTVVDVAAVDVGVDVAEGPVEGCSLGAAAAVAVCGEALRVPLAGVPEHRAVAQAGERTIVAAWSLGDRLWTVRVNDAGAALGEVVETMLEGPVSGLAAAASDEMTMVFYSVGRLEDDGAEGVTLRYRPVGDDGSVGEAVVLATNFELLPGGIPTTVGPRVAGRSHEVVQDVVYEMVSLTLLNHDGSVRTTHTVRTADSFAYYAIHASGARANYPYVEREQGAVSYYDQSVHLLSCGAPPLPVLLVKEDSVMLASGFWQGTGLWLVRNPEACDGAGGAVLTAHDTGPRLSEHFGLSWTPSDAAGLAVREGDGAAVLFDETAEGVWLLPWDTESRTLAAPRVVGIPDGAGGLRQLDVVATEARWVVARWGEQLDLLPVCAE